MKTLIVQGFRNTTASSWEWENMLVPCMKSVKLWAERQGFDYRFYADRLDESFDVGAWFPEHNLQRHENLYYKYQWMKDCAEYDSVYWFDSDILVWGNPALPKDEDLFFMYEYDLLGVWPKPRMSIWGGKTSRVLHYYDWVYSVFHYKCPEPALITCFKELSKAQLIPCITDETVTIAYLQEHPARLIDYADCTWAHNWRDGQESGRWVKDLFYHLGGENKVIKFQRIMSYIMYVQLQDKRSFYKNFGNLVE